MADLLSKAADNFVTTFYKLFDTQRHMVNKMYKDSAAILWNGNPYAGSVAYQEFCLKLPASSHDIQSYDYQPLQGEGVSYLLVNVTGTYFRALRPTTVE
ncbi:NTF2- export protein 2 [Chytridiales sp. JEL 0842]|nr:NTF2- export protein 2 [Chytridiales sp. JEL 0842]